ncbi:MAG: DNA repair protein RecN [Coriobacteriia bacterium]|nr:DNA repair protein RecN [Coriobacteriia bacterium]
MIDQIRVRNLALIEEALLTLGSGMTVVTGETGAGKTALLSAIRLLLGQRANADFVREGTDGLVVEGRFLGLPSQDGDADPDEESVVRRTVTAEGRSRATVNGDMVSLKQLVSTMERSADLCGQHDQQKLLKPAEHAQLLDDWAVDSLVAPLKAYKKAFKAAKAAADELERVQQMKDASTAQLDEARFILKRIDEVDPRPGEYEELLADLDRAEHAETLARAGMEACESLSGEGGALDGLNAAAAALENAARFDADLLPYAQSLREVTYVVEDVARDARSYADGIDFDPQVLLDQQERAAALQGLIRAYGPRMEDVLAARAEAADLVSLVDDSAQREAAARKAVDAAEADLAAVAQELHEVRVQAAGEFAQAVSAQMQRLEMGSASLECQVELLDRARWTSSGPSGVEFLFRPGAEMQPRPLARIASGGEISRVMLAVHVVMGERDRMDTLVFDEVDAGVGGATALALADVLADLSRTHQVLVVTHLPQVAVRADQHYVVQKDENNGLPRTQLATVEGDERVAEIARMLAGSATDASLAHARQLLEEFSAE